MQKKFNYLSGYGTIRYNIYAGDPDGRFSIDADSGAITLAKFLDRDKADSILLNVQVAAGNPPVYNHTQVFLRFFCLRILLGENPLSMFRFFKSFPFFAISGLREL